MPDSNSPSRGRERASRGLSRRELLAGLGAAAAAAYAGNAASAVPGHDHSKHTAQLPDLLNAINTCLDHGQRCVAHCLVTFNEGNLELAACASKVHEMQAVCAAYGYLLAANSEYVKAYADVCKQVCVDCEEACKKHSKHVECDNCGKACAEVVAQIDLRFS